MALGFCHADCRDYCIAQNEELAQDDIIPSESTLHGMNSASPLPPPVGQARQVLRLEGRGTSFCRVTRVFAVLTVSRRAARPHPAPLDLQTMAARGQGQPGCRGLDLPGPVVCNDNGGGGRPIRTRYAVKSYIHYTIHPRGCHPSHNRRQWFSCACLAMQTRWIEAGVPRRATRGCLLTVLTRSELSAAPRDLALPPPSVSEYVFDGRHLVPRHVGPLDVANKHPNGHWHATRPQGVAQARLCYCLHFVFFFIYILSLTNDSASRSAMPTSGRHSIARHAGRPHALTRSPLRLDAVGLGSRSFLICGRVFSQSLMLHV
ncbi:hypothetical protein LY78DRAFT_277578 [Colletotrichum sublineola]|nr:hypothetical protein LY78DRAFT_277578 [Colletotrichum sublineola]